MKYSIILFMISLWSLALGGLTNKELLSTIKHNKRKVLTLNDANFETILNGKRDYHLIALLTSEAPNINCVLCREISPEFKIIADSWFQDHPSGISEGEYILDGEEEIPMKNVYFFKSEFMESKKLFQILQLQNIPKIFYFPPTKHLGPNNFIREKVEYQFFQGDHRELMKAWFTDITGHSFNLYIPINKTRLVLNAICAFLLVILVKTFAKQIITFITSKLIWCAGSLIGVLLFTTGYMFNQIRGTPYLMEQNDGRVEYFAPGQQSQYGVETQIMSFVYGMLSILVIVLIKRAPEIKNYNVNLVLVAILSTMIFVMFSLLLSIFGAKGVGFPYRFINFF
ncbi:OST3 Dolichyl-diphosphooligosaccharide--protein glycosyltransferase subunit 3 [Candida maltosa Xu316]|uniref:Uncharacterized protein n=1 Tax=Candida maltosa (strain Xu316) TaxID=1245528 RepID=M3J735_CANMX|nr:hypothetical protein G210_1636 [Candida maltosa Xu316]